MTPSPRVSILMAVFNAQKFLGEALDSVLAQTEPSWELICVDDASTDGSLSILQAYAARDSRIRVVRLPANRGLSVARNAALSHAQGTWVMILDSDDWLVPDTLERALRCETPDADAILLDLIHHYPDRPPVRHFTPNREGQHMTGTEAFTLSLDWTLHALMLVRRELHLRYPYDERLRWYADDNTARLHLLHSRRVVLSTGQYHYRHHAESNTTAVTPRRFLLMEANRHMQQTLEEEGFPPDVQAAHQLVRWHNYVSLLRLYHTHSRNFTPDERRETQERFRRLYPTFHRRTPYPLFLFRQWAGHVFRSLFPRKP